MAEFEEADYDIEDSPPRAALRRESAVGKRRTDEKTIIKPIKLVKTTSSAVGDKVGKKKGRERR